MAANAQQGAPSGGQAIPGCNFVSQDRVWRDRVQSELDASQQWHRNWNFLTTDYEELVREQFPNRNPDKSKRQTAKNKLKELISVRPTTPVDQYITVLPSTKPVPRTTAGEVGWRSGDPLLSLDKYGSYARPCGSILKQLNWPRDAIN
ncbi:unnamed protein product [Candidula unifasciata]|uniref:Uncharacterized protein n=1 Tax=Candidula unifasciata TaxID=100452 RepID=A0A8S3YIE4_9EUPU|nr:unnamed protein product [Candidula unifasciata]